MDLRMKKAFLMLLAASVVAAATSPVRAQNAITLGERPIARAEVSAFAGKQFARMDTNHNGSVSPAECDAWRARQGDRAQTGLGHIGRRWFERTDTNFDGKVTHEEAVARPLGMFDMADVNRDGIASLREQSLAQILVGN